MLELDLVLVTTLYWFVLNVTRLRTCMPWESGVMQRMLRLFLSSDIFNFFAEIYFQMAWHESVLIFLFMSQSLHFGQNGVFFSHLNQRIALVELVYQGYVFQGNFDGFKERYVQVASCYTFVYPPSAEVHVLFEMKNFLLLM